jgi:hypothetical protein
MKRDEEMVGNVGFASWADLGYIYLLLEGLKKYHI